MFYLDKMYQNLIGKNQIERKSDQVSMKINSPKFLNYNTHSKFYLKKNPFNLLSNKNFSVNNKTNNNFYINHNKKRIFYGTPLSSADL